MLINRFCGIAGIASVLLMAAVTSGCATGNIRSDYDPTADFSQYETFNFFPDAGPEETDYQSFFSSYMIAAITREMQARGYTISEDPDILINFNANLREKTDVRTTPATPIYGSYYGYRGGFYDPWMGYGYAQETHVSQYTEGTFNIDLVDARAKKLVWEAVAVGRVTEKVLEEMEERINAGVAKAFAQYPFVAGSGKPLPTGN
ncbi:MAG TPA: DUF4136 domain-containing protein [Woeseiaceae bacterium]|nr:DUF4136 domain-containing protein [Woeseiaceae bacterium]